MYGLSRSGFCMRILHLLGYICMSLLRCISYYREVHFLRYYLQRKRYVPSPQRARKIRKYLAMSKQKLWLHILLAPLFSTLLLCGDIHPHPGPVFPGNNRHPDRQVIVVASWNVRTLYESKRTPIRPTAVVARELDRHGGDIAALS